MRLRSSAVEASWSRIEGVSHETFMGGSTGERLGRVDGKNWPCELSSAFGGRPSARSSSFGRMLCLAKARGEKPSSAKRTTRPLCAGATRGHAIAAGCRRLFNGIPVLTASRRCWRVATFGVDADRGSMSRGGPLPQGPRVKQWQAAAGRPRLQPREVHGRSHSTGGRRACWMRPLFLQRPGALYFCR